MSDGIKESCMKTTEFEFSFKGSVKQEKAERKRYSIKSYCITKLG